MPLDIYPDMVEGRLLHQMVVPFIFLSLFVLLSMMAAPVYIPTNNTQGFLFLFIFANRVFWLSGSNHYCRCKMTSHCGFDVYFPGD